MGGEELKHFSRYRRAAPSSLSSLGATAEGTLPWLPTLTDNSFFPQLFHGRRRHPSAAFFFSFLPWENANSGSYWPAHVLPWCLHSPTPSKSPGGLGLSCLCSLGCSRYPGDELPKPCHHPRGLSGKGPCSGKVQKQEITWEESEIMGEEHRFIGEEISGRTRVHFMTVKSILWYLFFSFLNNCG